MENRRDRIIPMIKQRWNEIKRSDKIILGVALLSMIVFMFWMIPNVSASLGTFQQAKCIQLLGSSDANSMNLSSITYPSNGTTKFITAIMTKNDKTFNYTFCDTNEIGSYLYNYYDSNGNVWVNDFEITTTGANLSIPQSILYALGFVVLIPLFLLSLYGALNLKWKNEFDNEGYVLLINQQKYGKLGCIVASYIILLMINYLAWNVSWAYLQFNILARIFEYFTWIMFTGLLVMIPILIFIVIYNWVTDNRIREVAIKGLKWRFK